MITATRIIPNLSPERLESSAQELLQKKGKEVHKFPDSVLYTTGDDSNGYYYLVSNHSGRVVYFVKYKSVRANGKLFGRQVLVWRSTHIGKTFSAPGLAKKVFNQYLLPRFGKLITDTQQTENGRSFWVFILNEAIDRPDVYVYVLDRRSAPNRLYRSTRETLDKDYDIVYGNSEPFERTHFVISSSELKEF